MCLIERSRRSLVRRAQYASALCRRLRIAQSGQPHTIGESLVLPSIKDAVGVLFGDTYLKEIELILLSNDTVARRIEDMAKWVKDQLINRIKGSKFFPCSWMSPRINKVYPN
ncbi:Zinc finger BED domain-containing protein [Trichinella spiralis]|uniref:Zinc finger BED domain-containing protein n=1 Tax=Trichinella spiralis TaxID=6334 RepID=A0ABR3K8Q7_TRISP